MKFLLYPLFFAALLLLLYGCSATRYVPQGSYLLRANKVEILNRNQDKKKKKDDKYKITVSELESYVQQRPNKKLMGIGLELGFYNATDSSKHNWWHKFFNEKLGSPPVILDSALIEKSKREMTLFLHSRGQLGANVTDTIVTGKRNRKATVIYTATIGSPFTINTVKYDIRDNFLAPIVLADTTTSLLKRGTPFERKILESERTRITENLRSVGFWGFNQSYIAYIADSVTNPGKVNITLVLRQLNVGTDIDGKPILENHPIYRLGDITINSAYEPTMAQDAAFNLDTVEYKGIDIVYKKKLYIRENILVAQLGMSPGELYDQGSVERTYNNIRSLGYTASIIFTPEDLDPLKAPIKVTTIEGYATTTQRTINCLVQCTPSVRQNFSVDFEASTTSDYYSLALKLGYQNRNLFRGAEDFNIAFRGAYEFTKTKGKNNSFEFGASTSLALPRFLIPNYVANNPKFSYSSTQLSLSYNIQRRPDYERSIISGVYGYSWTMRNGARFTINPADINVVYVPWISQDFLDNIDNPYLRNSYSSQLIAGLSATYYYNTNADVKKNGFTFRASFDTNGNLLLGLASAFSMPAHKNGESFFNVFGLRFAQYARASFDVSNRINIGKRSQIAWRFLLAGGYAYGNSGTLPFERLFFAGGSNSMRGWQVRTLGPGGTLIEDMGSYPNQLGDMRIEANFEYRVNVIGGFGMALFFDCGNIWMNGKGEARQAAHFRFDTFASQLALNTGVGIRYDFGYFLVRLDWGFKLHNPNVEISKRWFGNLGLNDTALHFAIGLPF